MSIRLAGKAKQVAELLIVVDDDGFVDRRFDSARLRRHAIPEWFNPSMVGSEHERCVLP